MATTSHRRDSIPQSTPSPGSTFTSSATPPMMSSSASSAETAARVPRQGSASDQTTLPRNTLSPSSSSAAAAAAAAAAEIAESPTKQRDYTQIHKARYSFGSKGSGRDQFNCPWGLATNKAGDLIICDCGNHRIKIHGVGGQFKKTTGRMGTKCGEFNFPAAVHVTDDERVIIADSSNNRLQVMTVNGEFITSFGSKGSAFGQLERPENVTTDAYGNVLVVDHGNGRVMITDQNYSEFSTIGIRGIEIGEFHEPIGVVLVNHSVLGPCFAVADNYNHRIQTMTVNGEFITSFGSKGSAFGQLCKPYDVTTDAYGNVLVVDHGNGRVMVYAAETYTPLAEFGKGELDKPMGVCVTSEGLVAVSCDGSHKIFVF
ncbi:protein wech-like [Sycon ciliatum]|uniref:protein wech-like n=1 Tax=Sycon ciliatum TaxID=27933 RepID=UPI0031F716B3